MAASSRQSPIANFFRRSSNEHHTHFVPNHHDTAADFEFHEADLYLDSSASAESTKIRKGSRLRRMKVKVADESRSVPVCIPPWSNRVGQAESEGSDDDNDDEEQTRDRVPPHEYLARRRGVSLSVHEGVGRTLKGRDMSRVRDAVWKRIGFED